jgi:hypothetical protein
MSEIFREIDEELRRDNLGKLWARYGAYIIGLAVLLVIATGAVTGWRWYEGRLNRAQSVRYAAAMALAQKNEPRQAADAFALLAREGSGGQAMLARFQEAALSLKAGDDKAALATYQALAQDGSVDTVYRDLATLLAALQELNSTADPKSVIAEVEKLTAEGNPWRPSALEITALANLKAGDRDKARDIYKSIADDLTAPQGLRARAAEMAASLAS